MSDHAVSQDSQPALPVDSEESVASATTATPEPDQRPAKDDSPQERNWRELREDREYWRAEAQRLRNETQRQQAPQPQPEKVPEAPKTLADFEYDEAKFAAHLREVTRMEAAEAARAELAKERERQAEKQRQAAFAERQKAFAKDNPEYHAAVSNPRFVQSDALLAELMESEEGPAIAMYLANNLDKADMLNQLPPVAVAREVARLESKLIAERAKAKEAKNQLPAGAPPPVPKLEGSDAALDKDPTSADSDNLSPDEWLKRRNKQLRKLNQRK